LLRSLFRTKTVDEILETSSSHAVKRALGPVHVTLLGVGAIIGAGIYATIGTAVAGDAGRPGAGPSLMLSFVITAVVCGFTALCYAEFASMVPVSGSAYTYSYATLGELVAWIIGWDLMIEYAIGNVAVAISWSSYFQSLIRDLFPGYQLPLWLGTDFRAGSLEPEILASAPRILGLPIIVNLPAFAIVMAITVVLVIGIKESAKFNALMVAIKIGILLFFIAIALWYVSPAKMAENWVPFQPNGWSGTLAGAAIIFFAYIGFDAVSTVSEETKNPGRDLPIGIGASLAISALFYVAIAAVFTGILPYSEMIAQPAGRAEPLTMALHHAAPNARWAAMIVAFGSVVASTAVLLVFQLGQPRIFFAMARDGLLPPFFARLHPRFKTPHVTTILTGLVVGTFAAFASLDEMVDLTNIGTLFAFVLVCIGIPIMRFREPDRRRPFRVPFGPFVLPILGAASCLFLMYYLPPASWWRFIGWLTLGLSVYSAYGYSRSGLGQAHGRPSRTPGWLKLASVGFLLAAVGLFTIPHDFGLMRTETLIPKAQGHDRALIGLCLIVVGYAAGILGAFRGTRSRRNNPG
jgi:APA family basic amino acid/polyamine antiporter